MNIEIVEPLKTTVLSWEEGSDKEGVDLVVAAALPSWAEPFLVECEDKPGVFEPIEVRSGVKHQVLIAHGLTRSMIQAEQARRQQKLFIVSSEVLARLTKPQRKWVVERSIESAAPGAKGRAVDLAQLSMDELHTLDSFFEWICAHKFEKKRIIADKNNLSSSNEDV